MNHQTFREPRTQFDFDRHFELLTGRSPYRWQRRLFDELLADVHYDALDLPTGLGKTSVLTIWLLARAAGARIPHRLVYVVDRRAVVDQASAEAANLQERLAGDGEGMAALRTALGMEGAELPVSTLRGQLADNRQWLQQPQQVAIIVGTVDMIGSRLLFSGYGVTRRMRPVHAALLGSDALIVLDEAHLVPPFEALVSAVARMAAAQQAHAPLPVPPMRLLSLSATGRSASGRRFGLQDEDRADPAVALRLGADKRLRVAQTVAFDALAQALADRASALAGADGAVVVFCDSRKVAQAVRDALAKLHGDKPRRVELLVGERRVRERARLAGSAVFARFDPARHRAGASALELDGPAFLVATSAGEVGVDLDADHMVCDLVAWERMVQRLGRVNRRPVAGRAQVVVIPADPKADKDGDADAIELAALRAPFDNAAWPVGEDGCRDASPDGLLALKRDAAFTALADAATTPVPLHPALTLATVQAWAMTSLQRHPGRPLVAPWLRGWREEQPQCRVLWRAWLPLRADERRALVGDVPARRVLDGFFAVAPPHLSETIEAPVWRVIEVLRARLRALQKVEHDPARPLVALTLNDAGEVDRLLDVEALQDSKLLERNLAERTLVLDARLGGLDADGLLDGKADGAGLTTLENAPDWAPAAAAIGYRIR